MVCAENSGDESQVPRSQIAKLQSTSIIVRK